MKRLDKNKKNLYMVFAFIVLIRLFGLTMPILEGTATRQAQTATIARNFYRDGFNVLYPKVDWFGNAPGYLVLEFPLFNVLAASGYFLTGGVHEWVGRLLSILFFIGGCLFLYGIARKLFNEKIALWAMAVFGLSPLSIIFSRAYMPDFEMIFFSLGALYFLLKFYFSDKQSHHWLSALFLSLAFLVKLHSFYIVVPLFYLIWKKQKKRLFIDYKNWIYLIIAVMPAILWYMHAKSVHSHFTPQEAYNYTLTNWFNIKTLLRGDFYINIMQIYSGILLTPIGLTLFIAGLFIKTKGKENLIWPWLFGSIIFLIVFATHIEDPYYNLNFLPIASIIIARMIVFFSEQDLSRTFFKSRWAKVILILLIVPFWLRYTLYAYVVPQGYRYLPEAGKRVQELSQPKDLVIASASGGPQGLYFCDRKGFTFSIPQNPGEDDAAIAKLKKYISEGARYFVAAKIDDFQNSLQFKEYLFKHYKVADYQKGKFIIFELESKEKCLN